MVGKEGGFIQETSDPGRWWTNLPKTIFPLQAKPEGFKGENRGEGEKAYVQEKLVPRRGSWNVNITLNRLAGINSSCFPM